MTVQEITPEIKLPAPRQERSKGLHMSGIIRCIAMEMGILKPEWVDDLSLTDVREIRDQTAILRMSIGLAWEEWYIPQILADKGVIDHPGELVIDGVYGTPDGESLDVIITATNSRYVDVLHEVKATYKSVKTVGDMTGPNNWLWLAQAKAYCKAKGTRFVRFHVLFICGDYSQPIKPMLKEFLIEFEQSEIDQHWDLMMQYVQERMAQEKK